MHLLRGSGVNGLMGMQYHGILEQFDPRIPLVRPLLETPRAETERICAEYDIGFIHDESNSDKSYFRNKLRLELLPLLDSYQPGIRARLGKTGILMTEVDALLNELVKDAFDRVVKNDGPDFFVVSLPQIIQEKKAVQRALLREIIYQMRDTLRDVDFDAVERVMNLIESPAAGKRVEILDGLGAVIEGQTLVIKDAMVEVLDPDQLWMPTGEQINIAGPEGNFVSGKWEMELSVRTETYGDPLGNAIKEDHFTGFLDLDSLTFPLTIRTKQIGDRIQPFGMGGHSMKLADFWINSGLPRKARGNWPLVCTDREICWIPGFRIMEPFRVNTGTKQMVVLRVTRF